MNRWLNRAPSDKAFQQNNGMKKYSVKETLNAADKIVSIANI